MASWRNLSAAVLISTLPLCAAEISLTGRVVDENNAGVAGARVSFRTPAGQALPDLITDPTGQFAIRLAPGPYLVRAQRDGYFPLNERTVDLQSGPQELHLVLNHVREVFQSVNVSEAPAALDLDKTSAEQTLSNLEILDIPFPSTHDLRNAMKLMPNALQDPTGAVHFDGSSENQVYYSLDGFNIANPLTGQFDTRLDVDAVRALDYSSGRFSPEFGKGSAGTLAIRTDMGDDQFRYNATNFIPGVDSKRGLHLGAWSPRLTFSGPIVRGRAWFSEALTGEYNQTIIEDLPPGHDRTSSLRASNLLRTQVNLTPANILYGSFLINYWNAPGTGLSALDPPPTTINQRTRTWFYSFKDQAYLARGTLLEVGFAQDRTLARRIPQGDGFYILTPQGRQGNYFADSTQTSRRDQYLVNLFLPSFHLRGAHQLKTGIDLDRLDYAQNFRRTGYELFGLGGFLLRRVTFAGNSAFSRPSFEASSYLVDDWRPRTDLALEIGVRQDWDELIRHTSLSPRFSFSWAPFGRQDTKVSGGYAVTYDATSLQLFTRPLDQEGITTTFNPDGSVATGPIPTVFTIQNPRLKAPRYRNWTLSLDRQLPRKIQLSVSWLLKRGEDGFTYVNIAEVPEIVYNLTNSRRDEYDSAGVTVRQSFGAQYEWMASYTRSRAFSNAVLDVTVDQPLLIGDNVGRMPWDSPNRVLGYGYLPTPWKNWAVAFLVEARNGFPFSVQTDDGAVVGAVNSYRLPAYFNVNFHVERKFHFRGYRFALRGGFNNITNHKNPTFANNTIGAPGFLTYYGSEGRHFVARLRWLGKE